MARAVCLVLLSIIAGASAALAQTPDWKAVEAEALKTLQGYVRINTSNPPGDVTKAADFLQALLKREGIDVEALRVGAGPIDPAGAAERQRQRRQGDPAGEPHGRRADRSRRAGSRIRSAREIADGKMWGRGTIDMKGIGTSYLYASSCCTAQKVPLTRDVLLMFVPDEEIGGAMGAEWMRKNHYAELDPEYVIDEGGFGSRDMFTPGKLVFGISVAEKRIMWLRLRAEGVAGHGSQPHEQESERASDGARSSACSRSRSPRRPSPWSTR